MNKMKYLKPIRKISFLFVTLLLLIIACKDEELPEIKVPITISLSASSMYELLPTGSIVAILSTDLMDISTRYRLVSGEGDENNDQFEIKNGLLTNRTILLHKEGINRRVRVQSILEGATFEQALTIEIKEFNENYPTISSPSFMDKTLMPKNFGAENGNISPDLEVKDIPLNTSSIVLTMNDLDDNESWHWAVWNIPNDKTVITMGATWRSSVTVGNNDFGMGYVGPFPPSEHRYEIKAFFLESDLELSEEEYGKLPVAMAGKVIAQTSIIGLYRP